MDVLYAFRQDPVKKQVFPFIQVELVCFGCRGVHQKTQQSAAKKLSQIHLLKNRA